MLCRKILHHLPNRDREGEGLIRRSRPNWLPSVSGFLFSFSVCPLSALGGLPMGITTALVSPLLLWGWLVDSNENALEMGRHSAKK